MFMANVSSSRRRQERSLQSADRLISATESVLRTREFSSASLADIARAADMTTGAIYSSFTGKPDLLRALEHSVHQALEARAEHIFGEAPASLPEFCRSIVHEIAAAYEKHRGSLCSLAIAARDDAALAKRAEKVNRRILSGFSAAMTARVNAAGPLMTVAAEVGFLVVTSALRDRIVFQVAWPLTQPMTVIQLSDALATMLCGYICEPGAKHGAS